VLQQYAPRWGSWFKSVLHHSKYFEFYAEFIEEELDLTPETAVLANLQGLIEDQMLQDDIKFIANHGSHCVNLITSFEACSVSIHKAYNGVMDLLNSSTAKTTEELDSVSQSRNSRLQSVFKNMCTKLNRYYGDTGTRPQRFTQPGKQFMQAVRIFDPSQATVLRESATPLQALPGFSRSAKEQIPQYREYLKECAVETLTPPQFWCSDHVIARFPELARSARCYLSVLPNSVDAERAVSCFGMVFAKCRQSMKEGTINGATMLAYNSRNFNL